MSTFNIGSINAQNMQVGDDNTQHNTQHNTQAGIDGQLARLDAALDRHASLLPDVAAARRGLAALRVACAARPVDPRRVKGAAGELTEATAAAPAIRAEITRLLEHIPG